MFCYGYITCLIGSLRFQSKSSNSELSPLSPHNTGSQSQDHLDNLAQSLERSQEIKPSDTLGWTPPCWMPLPSASGFCGVFHQKKFWLALNDLNFRSPCTSPEIPWAPGVWECPSQSRLRCSAWGRHPGPGCSPASSLLALVVPAFLSNHLLLCSQIPPPSHFARSLKSFQ